MSDESTQLSVAELLARNGQGVPSSGGGRRRRSGRGISVTELTGDMPAVREGSSAHAAPEPETPEPDYSSPLSDYAPDPTNSPLSGPISYYDPLSSGTEAPSSNGYEPGGFGAGSGYDLNGYGAGGTGYEPGGAGANGYDSNGYGAHGAGGTDYGSNGYEPNGFGANGAGAAGYAPNGFGENSAGSNGYDLNGYGSSGAGSNGYGSGGAGSNGYGSDQVGSNGYGPNGVGSNGYDLNGFGAGGAGSNGYEPNGAALNGVAPPGFEPGAYEPPAFEQHTYQSPAMSDAALRDPTGFGWPGSDPAAPASDPFAAPATGGRRSRRERREAMEALSEQAAPAPPEALNPGPGVEGGRRRREPDIEATEIRPFGGGPFRSADDVNPPAAWAPQRATAPEPPPFRPPEPSGGAERPQLPRRNGAGGAPAALPAWSARRRQPPEPPGPQADHAAPPPGAPNGQTTVWALADRDQQLISGPTVAGDLLRAEPPARGGRRDFGRNGAAPPPVIDDRTDVYRPIETDDEFDSDEYDPDFEFDDAEDDELDDKPSRPWAERVGQLAARGRELARSRTTSTRSTGSRAAAKSADDVARQQWMVLGGQVAGAAIAGMLLFKGFEKMWDMLPFVALVLAMVVILGLVALVRVLRRTDDIMSTVIAVIVGIFVTLGPLAFLLSTN
ncbi:hypothetical protein IU476_15620 [Nocardia blacklockiae]|nr:hypothetical protein [Nocardia blacklockiae]